MDYMDQTMPCKKCGKEHNQLGTGVCISCEKQEKEEKAKAEWDAKSPVEQARSHLESWSNPTCYTFSRVRAKFVLEVFNTVTATSTEPVGYTSEQMLYGLESAREVAKVPANHSRRLNAAPRDELTVALYRHPSTQIPLEAIGKILTEVMDIAVANGANSISMPDEYVAIAHFLSFPEQYGLPKKEGK